MANRFLKPFKWSYKRAKNHDLFKQSISLTFRGKENKSSTVGTITSIMILLITVLFTIYYVKLMFDRAEVTWDQNTKSVNVNEQNATVTLKEGYSKMQISWYNFGLQIPDDINPFFVTFHVVNTNGETLQQIGTPLEPVEWFPEDIIDTRSRENLIKNGLYKQCIDLKDINLNLYKLGSNQVMILIRTWLDNPDSEWNDIFEEDSFLQFFENSLIEILFYQTDIDLENLENPIQTGVTGQISEFFQYGRLVNYILEAKKIEVFLEDSLFPSIFTSNVKEVYTIEHFHRSEEIRNMGNQTSKLPGAMLVTINPSTKIDQYKRKYLNILEVFGIVGGLFEILEVTIGVFIGFYSSYSFRKDLDQGLIEANRKYDELQKSFQQLKDRCEAQDLYRAHNEDVKEEQKQEENEQLIGERMGRHDERFDGFGRRRRLNDESFDHENFEKLMSK